MLFNRKIKSLVKESMVSYLVGDRGSGKSSLMALICDEFQKDNFPVYTNYPYKGAYQIPLIEKNIGGVKKYILDKTFLYENDLRDCLIMIDEARTVWNARAYSSWTESDEEFFNFIRKNNVYLVLASQRYDGLDLNIRFACEYTFFIQRSKWLKNFSTIDVSRSVQVKVADKNTQIVSKGYSKNAYKVTWEIAELPISFCRFYRKPYYEKFDTLFTTEEKKPFNPVSWDSAFDSDDAAEQSDNTADSSEPVEVDLFRGI